MLTLGPLGFTTPLLLGGLVLLPLLWLLLRALPPRPRETVFPGVMLLDGLRDAAPIARRMPWWLMLLRMTALAAAIIAFAGPLWRPVTRLTPDGPLLVVADAGWAAAPGWTSTQARGVAALEQAARDGRPAALLLGDGMISGHDVMDEQPGNGGPDAPGRQDAAMVMGDAAAAAAQLRAAQPQPWETRYPADPERALSQMPAQLSTLWLSDGLDHPERESWLSALRQRGEVRVVPPAIAPFSLSLRGEDPPRLVLRAAGPGPLPQVLAIGPDPQGTPRTLARLTPPAPRLTDGWASAELPLTLPAELRNRVTRFAIDGAASAGAVVLADDRVRRRKVGLLSETAATETQALLSPAHYLRGALSASADVIAGGLSDLLPAAPDVIVMADQPAPDNPATLQAWVENGGLLVRFAGPRMAASPKLGDDPLLPVRLRPGGRDMGGALSWGAPRRLADFPADGPFAGLAVPAEATVRAQLLPEPGPDLAALTLARLDDGTPLVTRKPLGKGAVVLIHTSADAEWSSLPLSGLFPQMLRRLTESARLPDPAARARDDKGTDAASAPSWTAREVLDGFGRVQDPGDLSPVPARRFAAGVGPGAPAGIYEAGARRAALNAGGDLVAAHWTGARIDAADAPVGRSLFGAALILALLALAVDAVASAMLAGQRRARGPGRHEEISR